MRSSQRFVAELAKFLPSPVTLRRHKCTNYNNGDGHDDGHGDSRDSSREMRKRTDEKIEDENEEAGRRKKMKTTMASSTDMKTET